jgi:hypothetical protein
LSGGTFNRSAEPRLSGCNAATVTIISPPASPIKEQNTAEATMRASQAPASVALSFGYYIPRDTP